MDYTLIQRRKNLALLPMLVLLLLGACYRPFSTTETDRNIVHTPIINTKTSLSIDAQMTTPSPTKTNLLHEQMESDWIKPNILETSECMTNFIQRELKEPYQRHMGQARFSLSTDQLNELWNIMSIQSMCIPVALGAPFINADWNSQFLPGVTGHMLSLGFENLYHGAGWSDGYMLYSTYDFSMGTAYDSFATREDFQAVMEKSISNQIDVNGVPGFIRYQKGLSLGLIPIYKAYIFPFEDFYTAVVYGFGPFEWEQVDIALARLQTGEVPNEHSQDSNLMDVLALSIQFLHSP